MLWFRKLLVGLPIYKAYTSVQNILKSGEPRTIFKSKFRPRNNIAWEPLQYTMNTHLVNQANPNSLSK